MHRFWYFSTINIVFFCWIHFELYARNPFQYDYISKGAGTLTNKNISFEVIQEAGKIQCILRKQSI